MNYTPFYAIPAAIACAVSVSSCAPSEEEQAACIKAFDQLIADVNKTTALYEGIKTAEDADAAAPQIAAMGATVKKDYEAIAATDKMGMGKVITEKGKDKELETAWKNLSAAMSNVPAEGATEAVKAAADTFQKAAKEGEAALKKGK